MRIELKDWTLTIIPHKEYCASGYPDRGEYDLISGLGVTIPAVVPGNFELDMVRAGLLENPYFGSNITKLRDLEDRHLFYRTVFDLPTTAPNELPVLKLDGVDTVFDLYINGEWVYGGENMFMSYEIPLNIDIPLKPTGNELILHIHPTMIEAQRNALPPSVGTFPFGYASLYARKAPSSFGWDILCRAVSGGIWKPVYIETVKTPAIRETFLYTRAVSPDPADHTRGYAELNLYYAVDLGGDTYYPFDCDKHPHELPNDYTVTVEGVCNDCTFSYTADLWHTCGNIFIPVHGAYLWYPKNAGQPWLYDVTVTLRRGDAVVDTKTMKTGIRTVELDRTTFAGDNGQFRFVINGKPVFAMGSNWVPLDAFHSRDAERLPKALEMLDEAGCNIIRCWGGNVYEDHAFFDFCDAHGIMVWQDFAMGCAIYPVDERMQEALREEVDHIVKKLRNHPSLCLWAGDNECDFAWWGWHGIRRDPSENVLTRKIIPDVLRLQDFTRPYLPSSPYLDEDAIEAMKNPANIVSMQGTADISEDHLWGPRDYFKGPYYRTAGCHFASETGYHGCPAPETLKTYIPEGELWPIFDKGTEDDPFAGDPKPSWFLHQTTMELKYTGNFHYRIRLMTSQVQHMFTETPVDLATYAKMSQISQAEAFKYFIERFRTAKWRRTGIIWWNLLDGWPQISDAVVNYDFTPKLAYFFIKRVQKPLHMAFADPENGVFTLMGINDTQKDVTFTYTVKDVTGLPADTDLNTVPAILSGEVTVPADAAAPAASLPVEGLADRFLYIEWTANGERGTSHFILEPEHLDYRTYMNALTLCGFDDWCGFDQ
ncbi:MAG: hypothetical protein E7661_10235 [Ruminococcaceae bacterium]|nr:hypothetical protein [Oscillospiraceae bacterium]